MNEAARRGELFHLWFHPHNFGINLEKNIQMLSAVLVHFDKFFEDWSAALTPCLGHSTHTMPETRFVKLAGEQQA